MDGAIFYLHGWGWVRLRLLCFSLLQARRAAEFTLVIILEKLRLPHFVLFICCGYILNFALSYKNSIVPL
jgi:hypothetical protein